MALDRNKLKQGFLSFFNNPRGVSDYRDAERKWADAFHAYALDAEDTSGDAAVNLSKAKFRSQLNFRGVRTAANFAQMIDRAFVSYWTGTSFAVGNLVVGLGAPCPNVGGGTMIFASEATSVVLAAASGPMTSALLPILLVPSKSYQQQAERIAAAIDSVTRSAVTVLISGLDTTPGPTGPLPVTNTCTLF